MTRSNEEWQAWLEDVWVALPEAVGNEEVPAALHPSYVQRDHRGMALWDGIDLAGWRELVHSWFAVAPDLAVTEIEVLGAREKTVVYRWLVAGHDTAGGPFELELFIVNRVEGERIASADLFDDREQALAFFGGSAAER